MNPICLICDQPATRVCIHPDCDINPFLCSGQCKHSQNLSQSVHTHNDKTRFIACKELSNRIKQIKDKVDLSDFYNSTSRQLKNYIEDIKNLLERYQKQFKGKQQKLKKRVSDILDNLKIPSKNKKLTGKQIFQLANLENILDPDCVEYKALDVVKTQIGQVISKLQDIDFNHILNPERAEVHAKQGKKLYLLKRYKESLKQLQVAGKMNPFNDRYHLNIEECQKIVHENQKLKDIVKDVANDKKLYNAGMDCYTQGKFQQAIVYFTKAIQANGNMCEYFRNRGNSYDCLGKDDKAMEDFTKAILLNPKDDASYNNRALIRSKLGDELKAVEDYNKAISLDSKTPGYYFNRGISQIHLKNEAQAIRDFTEAILLDDKNQSYYNERAMLFCKKGDFQKAIHDLNKAIKLDPKKQFYANRAAAYIRIGEYDKAKADQVVSLEMS